MANAGSQDSTQLREDFYDDPDKLSQLLRQRAGNINSFHFTTTTEGTHSSVTAPAATKLLQQEQDASPRQEPAVPQRDPPRRAPTDARYVQPGLPKHDSAPVTTAYLAKPVAEDRMYHSFDAVNCIGDTQPDSQLYKQWTSTLQSANPNASEKPGTSNSDALVGPSTDEHHHVSVESPTVIHDEENEPETQLRDDGYLTSPLKFQTPAMAGHKRDSQGQMLSSAARTATTPGTGLTAVAFFPPDMGNGVGKPMSLTQIFNATQAATSPLTGAANQDAVFQRPSPNFTNARHSTPLAVASSPTAPSRNDPFLRSSSEPRAEYITMKQSQERRSREVEDDAVVASVDQDSWDELAAARKERVRRKAMEKFQNETSSTFTKVTAPSLPSPRQAKRGGKLSSLPAKKKKTRVPARRMVAYDGPYDDDELVQMSRPGPVKEQMEMKYDDSPDELSEGIPSSARSSPLKNGYKGENKVQVPRTSSHPQATLSGRTNRNSPPGSPSAQLHLESQSRDSGSQALGRHSGLRNAHDPVAIMDSQPDAMDTDSMPRPKSLVIPSSPSMNQYSINQTTMGTTTGFTSQLVSSSMPPQPPTSSSDEERVPSSPPPLKVNEDEDADDPMYDEHNYDEPQLTEEDEDAVLEGVIDDDIELNVDDAEDDTVAESQHDDVNDEEGIEEDDEKYRVNNHEVMMTAPAEEDSENGGDEAAETAEEKESSRRDTGKAESVRPSHREERKKSPGPAASTKARFQRQNTIPESDMLDDTQPSNFDPNSVHASVAEPLVKDGTALSQPSGTEPFHTAQEHPSGSGSDQIHSVVTEKTSVVTGGAAAPRFRSLNEIANQPESQGNIDIGDIEIPSLNFTDPTDDFAMSGTSPLKHSAKKRRITYSVKRRNYMSPIRDRTPVIKQTASSPPHQNDELPHDGPSAAMEGPERASPTAADAKGQGPSVRPTTLKQSTPVKHERVKSQRKAVQENVKETSAHKPPPPVTTPQVSTAAAVASPSTTTDIDGGDAIMAEAESSNTELPGPETSNEDAKEHESSPRDTDESPKLAGAADNASNSGERPDDEFIVSNRIFALWPGQGYYPATSLGYAGPHHVKVRYDEGSIHTLDLVQVRALDLRIGDHVKVDEKGMKKNTYVVVGFKDRIGVNDEAEYPLTDRYGYKTVVLEVKQRDSLLPAAPLSQGQSAVSAPLEKIYLTAQLSGKFRDRMYDLGPPSTPVASTSRPGTPGSVTMRHDSPSLSRRGTAGPSLLRESLRADSVGSSLQEAGGTVFSNMAFAVTLHNDEDDIEKNAIAKMIGSNGGQVLDGFNELFDYIDTSEAGSSRPTSSSNENRKSIDTSISTGFFLKRDWKSLQFAALITDTHSRRTKYIQALALNIPCLHHRWVTDSIAASRPLPFGKYLLCAGISTYLDPEGVLRSRNMQLYDPAQASFEEVVKSRQLLLRNQSVLLITGKTKKEVERKKPYLFLTHALGPRVVGRCPDIAAAAQMIKDGNWDWVYVDGGAAGLMEAENILFDRGASLCHARAAPKSKKRKRMNSVESEVLVRVGEIAGKKVRLACDEFVIQSLILGALLEE